MNPIKSHCQTSDGSFSAETEREIWKVLLQTKPDIYIKIKLMRCSYKCKLTGEMFIYYVIVPREKRNNDTLVNDCNI